MNRTRIYVRVVPRNAGNHPVYSDFFPPPAGKFPLFGARVARNWQEREKYPAARSCVSQFLHLFISIKMSTSIDS